MATEAVLGTRETGLGASILRADSRPSQEEVVIPTCDALDSPTAVVVLALLEGWTADTRDTPHGATSHVGTLEPPGNVSVLLATPKPIRIAPPNVEEAWLKQLGSSEGLGAAPTKPYAVRAGRALLGQTTPPGRVVRPEAQRLCKVPILGHTGTARVVAGREAPVGVRRRPQRCRTASSVEPEAVTRVRPTVVLAANLVAVPRAPSFTAALATAAPVRSRPTAAAPQDVAGHRKPLGPTRAPSSAPAWPRAASRSPAALFLLVAVLLPFFLVLGCVLQRNSFPVRNPWRLSLSKREDALAPEWVWPPSARDPLHWQPISLEARHRSRVLAGQYLEQLDCRSHACVGVFREFPREPPNPLLLQPR